LTPRKVVFVPDILIAALYDGRARELLNQWRDGRIIAVVTRDLLVLYLRTFGQVGLPPELIRKWSLWLTTSGKALYFEDVPNSKNTGLALCREVAQRHSAEVVTLTKIS
jgi:hypothetical protein